MREIKFRGKAKYSIKELDEEHFRHDNGWMTGNLIVNSSHPYIVGDFVEVDREYVAHEFWMPVHPESVGQLAGLKDKKGLRIYERDIVKRTYNSGNCFIGEVVLEEAHIS